MAVYSKTPVHSFISMITFAKIAHTEQETCIGKKEKVGIANIEIIIVYACLSLMRNFGRFVTMDRVLWKGKTAGKMQ